MSRRITLTDIEIRHIIRALRTKRNEFPKLNAQVIIAGQQTLDDLIAKLEGTRITG